MTDTITLSLCCKKRARLIHLEADVVLARLGAHADLFDFALVRVPFGLPLLLLVLELAVVHDAAHRRPLIRCHFNEIQIGFAGTGQRFVGADNAQQLAIGGDDPHR